MEVDKSHYPPEYPVIGIPDSLKDTMILKLHPETTLETMGNLTITLQQCFTAFSEASTHLIIEGDEVETITVPAIRLLLAAVQGVVRRGGTFRLQNPSSELMKELQALGLEEFWLKHPFNQKKPL